MGIGEARDGGPVIVSRGGRSEDRCVFVNGEEEGESAECGMRSSECGVGEWGLSVNEEEVTMKTMQEHL